MKAQSFVRLFAVSLITLFAGSSSFAMHAYSTAHCSGKLPNGKDVKIAFASGSYSMALLGQDDVADREKTVNIEGTKLNFYVDGDPVKLLLAVRYEKAGKTHDVWDDKCWENTGSAYTSVVEVKSVDADLGKELGVTTGSNILLSCEDNVEAPAGNCKD